MKLHEWGARICGWSLSMGRRAQLHDEAFGGAAGFQELGELDLNYVEAPRFELGAQLRADAVHDYSVFDIDRIAREADGVNFLDDDSFFLGIKSFDPCDGGLVERLGEVHDIASFEGSEACVEMVEARVDEM